MLTAFGHYLTLIFIYFIIYLSIYLFIYYFQTKLMCKDLPFSPLKPQIAASASGASLHPSITWPCAFF